ncbi:hypothetical protein J7E99_39200 [Streptomyces sp. ISL-44]|uniref:hypothetical protein n=1 Tax=Streptomyces sp. ISL-44 TaxID=2819184 RepID=UPI001BE8B9EA|nr:hypothetical protein [Streptomyces sp. ISL-44]MBT2546523.1 hypothetical protein [Streptomyces sp. ISL-44]
MKIIDTGGCCGIGTGSLLVAALAVGTGGSLTFASGASAASPEFRYGVDVVVRLGLAKEVVDGVGAGQPEAGQLPAVAVDGPLVLCGRRLDGVDSNPAAGEVSGELPMRLPSSTTL